MKDILPAIKSHLPDAVSKILKSDCELSAQELSPAADNLAVSYNIEGEVLGKVIIVYDRANDIARRFLSITIGDPEAASTEESCQEVGNQVLGFLFGSLCNTGTEIRLSSFGNTVSTNGSDDWLPASSYISTLVTEEFGNIHFYYSIDFQADLDSEHHEETEDTSNRTKVMIVDDSPVMCAFLKKIFIEMNYEIVAIAEDGLEALKMFEKHRPELVTLDIMMPKLKGTDVLKEIIKIAPETTVVMASSIADAKTVMNCLRMGAKRYIVKPYDKESVVSAIEKALKLTKD